MYITEDREQCLFFAGSIELGAGCFKQGRDNEVFPQLFLETKKPLIETSGSIQKSERGVKEIC